MTRVVNFKKMPFDVYIGRAGHGYDGYFGNPILINGDSKSERERVLRAYRVYFADRILADARFRYRVEELRGKVLGCFCKPKACHGDIIAQWLNEGTVDEPKVENSPCLNPFIDVPMDRQHTI